MRTATSLLTTAIPGGPDASCAWPDRETASRAESRTGNFMERRSLALERGVPQANPPQTLSLVCRPGHRSSYALLPAYALIGLLSAVRERSALAWLPWSS